MNTITNNELLEEADIVDKAKKDIQYFEHLYNKYFERIFRPIYRKTEDEHVMANLTQHVFMNAMKALPKYEFRNVSFGAWLYKIASNESNKHFRDERKHFMSLENHKVDLVMKCDELNDDESRSKILRTLVGKLDDDEIKIIEFKYFEDKNFNEIAFIFDKNESTVKMRMYRALKKLKPKLSDSVEMRSAKYLVIKSLQKIQAYPVGMTKLFGNLFKSEN